MYHSWEGVRGGKGGGEEKEGRDWTEGRERVGRGEKGSSGERRTGEGRTGEGGDGTKRDGEGSEQYKGHTSSPGSF